MKHGPFWKLVENGPAFTAAIVVVAVTATAATFAVQSIASLVSRRQRRLNVIIVGGSRGIGFALAAHFHKLGDNVVITSRSETAALAAAARIREEYVDEGRSLLEEQGKVFGVACDLADPESLENLGRFAMDEFGSVDIWINNAAITQEEKLPLMDTPVENIRGIITTNSLGSLLGARTALRLFRQQGHGHVFLMDGGGSSGMSTATWATYGYSKAGLPQLLSSLLNETKQLTNVGVHLLSPGLVLTDLLLGGVRDRREEAPTVASYLVPRVRDIVFSNTTGTYVKFLTLSGVVWRFATAFARRDRLINVDEYLKRYASTN